jgi:hypothetical protein
MSAIPVKVLAENNLSGKDNCGKSEKLSRNWQHRFQRSILITDKIKVLLKKSGQVSLPVLLMMIILFAGNNKKIMGEYGNKF